MTGSQLNRYYTFGPFRVDVSERILFGEKGAVPLRPKAFDTLLVLIENKGHVLSKDELMEKVWPDSFVEQNNLAQHVSSLRKALGDDGRKFIETVPKRGYRFVADVRASGEGEERMIETKPGRQARAGRNAQRPQEGASFLRDVVIIGRAIDFN